MFGARKLRKVNQRGRTLCRPQIEILEDRYAPAVVMVLHPLQTTRESMAPEMGHSGRPLFHPLPSLKLLTSRPPGFHPW